MIKIYGKNLRTGIVELIDTCSKREAGRMASEYAQAFGPTWLIWIGLRRDEPS